LFLFPAQFKTMKQWLKQDSGIILLTGPTGCGKSTTMYSLLESMLNEQSFQAITLEDPVERKLDHVIQVEVNERAGITYQSGLKAALRHDPDVLLIGEIRDSETAAFAFEAALTGHLVLSTLHAKDAPGTIERLLDLGINRVDIMQTLIAVASIQLVPITQDNQESKRAAIVELLDGLLLQNMIEGNHQKKGLNYQSFQQLKEKAYLYGFISKEVTKDPTNLKEYQQLLFLKRLNRLLDHGYSFTDALEVIKWDRQFEQVAEIIRLELTKGKYMDEAFKTAGFHATVVSYIYFVRINGDVLTSMNKCIQM